MLFKLCLVFPVCSALGIGRESFVDVPLPPFNNVPTNRSAWGSYDIQTDYAHIVPQTRVTKEVCHPSGLVNLRQEVDMKPSIPSS